MKTAPQAVASQSPVVICGTGGSGTRLLEQFFEKSGFFMGSVLNKARDAIQFQPLLGDTIRQVLTHSHDTNYSLSALPVGLAKEVTAKFRTLIEEHAELIPEDATGWGWKNPRLVYLLPFIQAVRPDFHFIHMVRDGRDMALSGNQNQLKLFNWYLFGHSVEQPNPLSSIRMWQKVNLGAANFARRSGCNYTLVRYEDLCLKPDAFNKLAAQFNLPPRDASSLVNATSIGRYQKLPKDMQDILESAAADGLKQFGYLDR